MKTTNRVHKNTNGAIKITQSQTERDEVLDFNRKLIKTIGGRKNLAKLDVLQEAMELRLQLDQIRSYAENISRATNNSKVLFELISRFQDWREHRDGSVWDRERTDKFNFGIEMLIDHVQEEATAAAEALMAIAYKKNEQSQPVSAA